LPLRSKGAACDSAGVPKANQPEVEITMSQQHQNESKTPAKGGTGDVSNKPDKANEIIQKSGQSTQQRRDAHTNSSAAGKDSQGSQKANPSPDDDSDDSRDAQHGSQADRHDERPRTGK
jgi:hypothetical protein